MVFYGVWAGRKTGIFTNWKECEDQVKGFSYPKYKKLQATTKAEAEVEYSVLKQEYEKNKSKKQKEEELKRITNAAPKPKNKENIFYGVWVGHQIGVYDTWPECDAQINGYKNSIYKKIYAKNKQEAQEQFFEELKAIQEGKPVLTAKKEKEEVIINKESYPTGEILTVDGASDNQTSCEYQAVFSESKRVAFKSKVFDSGTNNIAEFLGLVDAIKYILEHDIKPSIVYTDSLTAMAWLKNKKANTTARETGKIKPDLDEALINAEKYLIENEKLIEKVKVLKWMTKEWGEIPSDFGRK